MNNHLIAQKLLAYARQLEGGANLYRVRSYRHAAMVIDGLDQPLGELLAKHGRAGLARLPGIGDHLAYTLEMLIRTGKLVTYQEGHQVRKVA